MTRTTYLSLRIVADLVHVVMVSIFPDRRGLFQQCTLPQSKNEFKVLSWPPNSSDIDPANAIEHLWNLLDKQVRYTEAPSRNLRELKVSAASLQISIRVHAATGQGCFG